MSPALALCGNFLLTHEMRIIFFILIPNIDILRMMMPAIIHKRILGFFNEGFRETFSMDRYSHIST
jgi:hypothetical protein